MATHINTINALKGLTRAASDINRAASHLGICPGYTLECLTDAGIEIERLNSEAFKLRQRVTHLEEFNSSFEPKWDSLIFAIMGTDAGKNICKNGHDKTTELAVQAIHKTESERKEAQRTAEAFQKAQPKAEPTEDIFDAARREIFTNYFPAPDVLSALTNRRAGLLIRGRYRFILTEIIDEAVRASEIHPKWPTDALHAVSILTEESGELMKAAIEYHYNNADIEAVREEAVQTGAMALRVLLNIDKYKRPSDEK
ncbi:hypothetical protein ABEH95_002995 [Yersinia enterocolitica]